MPTIFDDLMDRLTLNPLFYDLSTSLFQKLSHDCSVLKYGPDEVVYREGEYSEDFYIVLQGMVKLTKSTSAGNKYLGSVGKSDFFGEMGPLSGHPRWETAETEAPSYLLAISRDIFHELLSASSHIKELVDKKYLQRAIFGHLRIAPLFECIEEDRDLMPIIKAARLVSFQKGERLATEGEAGDGFYMIRNGYAKVTKLEGGREKIITYLRENMYFGEAALVGNEPWIVSVTALTSLEAIRIDKEAFRQFLHQNYQLAQYINRTWNPDFSTSGVSGAHPSLESAAGELDVFISRGVMQAKDAIVIDLDKCTRCNRCVTTCREVHGDVSRLVKRQGFRFSNLLYATACYNCESPDCMLGCKFSAITRDPNGNIRILEDNCTGCSVCVTKCPYNVIQIVELKEEEALPFMKLFKYTQEAPSTAPPSKKAKQKRKVVKCDRCSEFGFSMCVWNCPTEAIQRGDLLEEEFFGG